jgi:hypothetical protein
VVEGSAKVNQDLANLERELAMLKEEMITMRPKAESLAPPSADVVVPPVPSKSGVQKTRSSCELFGLSESSPRFVN